MLDATDIKLYVPLSLLQSASNRSGLRNSFSYVQGDQFNWKPSECWQHLL